MKKLMFNKSHLIRMVMLLALMLVANGAWAQTDRTLGANVQNPQPNGQWVDGWNYKWTASSYNTMQLYKFDNGELANYKYFSCNTWAVDNGEQYRIIFMFKDGSRVTKYYNTNFGHNDNAAQNNPLKIVFAEDNELKDKNLSDVTEIQFGGNSNTGDMGLGWINIGYPRFTVNYSGATVPGDCDWWYTVNDGAPIRETRDIDEGSKITYHATDANPSYLINGWYQPEVGTQGGNFKYGNSYTVQNLSANIHFIPEFQIAHTYVATVQGEGGRAIVYLNGDGNKENVSGKKFPGWSANNGVVFEATADAGYRFSRWAEGGNNNPLTFNDHESGQVYTRTAIFESDGTKYMDAPKCEPNQYLSCYNLNVENCTFSYDSNQMLTVEEGKVGIVSIKYKNPINMYDLKKYQIGTGGHDGNVQHVEFINKNGVNVQSFWSGAANKDVEANAGKLGEIKEIKIFFTASTHIEWIRMDFGARVKTPVLKDGVTYRNMVVYQGSPILLQINDNAGYWREYTDDTYTTLKTDRITDHEWSSSYSFDTDANVDGEFYFGVMHGFGCVEADKRHESGMVKVKVRVKPSPFTADNNHGSDTTFKNGKLVVEESNPGHYNFGELFTFPCNGNNHNVSQSADNFSGFKFTAEAVTSSTFRVLIYVDGEDQPYQHTFVLNQGAKQTFQFNWEDFGIAQENVSKIRAINVAGPAQGGVRTEIQFSDAYLNMLDLYNITFHAAGGWGVANGLTAEVLNNGTTATTVGTPDNKGTETIAAPRGSIVRIKGDEYKDYKYLKTWTITTKNEYGEDVVTTSYDGIPNGGIAWAGKQLQIDVLATQDMDVRANYGRTVNILWGNTLDNAKGGQLKDGVHGNFSVVYDNVDYWAETSCFREDTPIQLVAKAQTGYHFVRWELSYRDNQNQVGTFTSNMRVLDLKLDRANTNGTAYTNILATPVFEEGTDAINTDVELAGRWYHIYKPTELNNKPAVLFSLHGTYGQQGEVGVNGNENADHAKYQNYNAIAEREKFIVIYPIANGDNNDWAAPNGMYGNADVKFFEDILDDLSSQYAVDLDRVYITGYGSGAAMASTAVYTSNRFAAYANVNGYAQGANHMQQYGYPAGAPRPLPYMHVHANGGSSFSPANVPVILDNIVNRNGCNPVPTVENVADGTKTSFSGKYPVVYYQSSTTGWGFQSVNIDGNNSKEHIWNFLSQFTRPNINDYNNRERVEFSANTEKYTADYPASEHGWFSDPEGDDHILLQYGDAKTGNNVYHNLQLGRGYHNISFTSSSDCPNLSTMWVTVVVDRLGKLTANGLDESFAGNVLTRDYNIGDVSFNIDNGDTSDDIYEYRLTFKWGNSDDTTVGEEYGKNIKISVVKVLNNTGNDKGKVHNETDTNTKEWFQYHGRMIAKWDFDLADGARFNRQYILENPDYWKPEPSVVPNDGIVTYSYLGTNITNKAGELTYDGDTRIPITAGLKFKSPDPKKVQFQATYEDGIMVKLQLVLDAGVELIVPYARNTFRNYLGHKKTASDGNSEFDENIYKEYDECLQHINRDLVYVSSSPNIFDAIDNVVNGQINENFFTGGKDDATGPLYDKLNYLGAQDGPCVIRITDKVTIDRMGVNRNLVSSLYSEFFYDNTGLARPYPGYRYVASPAGFKLADVNGTNTRYDGAIALTFGGWTHNNSTYKDLVKDESGNSEIADVVDSWNDLNVYNGATLGNGNQDYNIKEKVTDVPDSPDGFPVFTYQNNPGRSEYVKPGEKTTYYDKSEGLYQFANNSSIKNEKEKANYTPWTLPARGAHLKFEPTLPGVLNVDLVQEGGVEYYIADEFGKLYDKDVYVKTGLSQEVSRPEAGRFEVAAKDYVKYSFDVYPGKTYYIFSNGGGIGFAGFYFEPYVARKYTKADYDNNSIVASDADDKEIRYELDRINVGIKTAELDINNADDRAKFDWNDTDVFSYTNELPAIEEGHYASHPDAIPQKMQSATQPITYNNRAVHMTLPRSFKANQWQTICLPYSMNNLQMEQVFGKGSKVILLRDVQTNDDKYTHAYFVEHMNQDIIAGYPYLIWPTQSVEEVVSNAYINESDASATYPVDIQPISIASEGPNLVTYFDGEDAKGTYANETQGKDYQGIDCYTFMANFKKGAQIPNGSYVLSNGKLTRLPKGTNLDAPAYVAYLNFDAGLNCKDEDYNKASIKTRIGSTNYVEVDDEEATAIEDLLLESGIVAEKTDVYSVNGTKVRSNTDNLKGLSKGVYIVNGKKYIVK